MSVCKCVLPPGDNPIALNKYIISYHGKSSSLVLIIQFSEKLHFHLTSQNEQVFEKNGKTKLATCMVYMCCCYNTVVHSEGSGLSLNFKYILILLMTKAAYINVTHTFRFLTLT